MSPILRCSLRVLAHQPPLAWELDQLLPGDQPPLGRAGGVVLVRRFQDNRIYFMFQDRVA